MTDFKQHEWLQLQERVIFRNKYIGLRNDLVKRPDGSETEYVVIEGKDFVTIICKTDSGKILLIRCFIYPWNTLTWLAVGGVIDPGETPKQAAKREAEEETGYIVKKVTFLQKCRPTFLNIAWNYVFLAEVEKDNSRKPIDPNEIVSVREFSLSDINQFINDGSIIHSSTLIAILSAKTANLL
ncbi:MAG: NUDIX hydrolase [Asgard group archaeon]|nr:NUDIX hydrolase [Asgard group archaeon]